MSPLIDNVTPEALFTVGIKAIIPILLPIAFVKGTEIPVSVILYCALVLLSKNVPFKIIAGLKGYIGS